MFVPNKLVRDGKPQSSAVKRALKEKLRCHRVHRRERSERSLELLQDAKNAVADIVTRENAQFERSLLDEPDIRKFYGYVNNKLRSSYSLSIILEHSLPVDDSRKAELFCNQFSSVFVLDNGIPGGVPDKDVILSLSDILFSNEHVSVALSGLNSKTSCGDDGLPPLFFKKCCTVLVKPLKQLFQCSFETSELPQCWRDAVVVPIYKNKGNRSEVVNYRPISVTSVPCRLMESVLKFCLVNHLLYNGLISQYQHGFLAKRSTTTNLLYCLNDWFCAVDKRECIDVLYIDIAKAFDSVSHPKLLFKLEKYGIRGKFLSWIKSFLSGRRQRVKVGESYSSFTAVTSGVPQGSVLGPILFLIYINDLAHVVNNCSISIFADDSKIYFKADTDIDVAAIQSDIDRVLAWCHEWQLDIAAHKCNILHIGRRNQNHSYNMGAAEIPAVDSIKDLGVTVKTDLTFSLHIGNITKQAFQRLNLVFRAFCSRDVNLLLKAYLTYVRPLLEYNTTVWSPFLMGDIVMLEKVQRNFTRRLRGFGELSYRERLDKLELESLEERRIRFDLVEAFKIIRGLSVLSFGDFFEFKNDSRTRGHAFQLRLRTIPRLDICKNFFANRVVNMWNDLPAEAVSSNSVTQFKAKIAVEYLRIHCRQSII